VSWAGTGPWAGLFWIGLISALAVLYALPTIIAVLRRAEGIAMAAAYLLTDRSDLPQSRSLERPCSEFASGRVPAGGELVRVAGAPSQLD
jgi:hypothetical protein